MTTTLEAPVAVPEPAKAPAAMGVRQSPAARTVRYALLLLFALFVLIPMYVLIVTSLKRNADITTATAWSLPPHLSFSGWAVLGLVLAALPATIAEMRFSKAAFRLRNWRSPDTRRAAPARSPEWCRPADG